jgi:hypothetical protein
MGTHRHPAELEKAHFVAEFLEACRWRQRIGAAALTFILAI